MIYIYFFILIYTGGLGQSRTADLLIFSQALLPTELPNLLFIYKPPTHENYQTSQEIFLRERRKNVSSLTLIIFPLVGGQSLILKEISAKKKRTLYEKFLGKKSNHFFWLLEYSLVAFLQATKVADTRLN